MKRVTYKSIIERQNNNSEFQDFPRLKDILVDLSVKNTPKVVRKLRLIGFPIEFVEYNDKKRIPGPKTAPGEKKPKPDFIKVPFPDAAENKKITRIGHDDPSKCPWRAMGYVGSRRFAIRCLEEQEDGTYLPKILCKGPVIFNEFATWELGRAEEADGEELTTFLGGEFAPQVRIQATFDDSKLGDVDYKVFIGSKDMQITEEIINQLRSIQEPSADELNQIRSEYNNDREEDSSLPEWKDFYEFGYDLKRIFKFTPPMSSSNSDTDTDTEDSSIDSTEESTSAEAEETTEVTTESTEDSDLDLGDINW